MSIVSIICLSIIKILLVFLIVILLILIIPFRYSIKLLYQEEDKFSLYAEYLIFRLRGFFTVKPKIAYELKLWNKKLIDSDKKNKKEKRDSIAETDFIQDKEIEKEITESKKDIKNLFLDMKKYEKQRETEVSISEEQKKEKIDKAYSVIDKYKNITSSDNIYVIKKIVKEAINVIEAIRPSKTKVNIEYGAKDPYDTGMTLAVIAPFYSVLGKGMKVKPHFDKEVFNGSIQLIGYPMLIRLVIIGIRVILDEKVRLKIFKKRK